MNEQQQQPFDPSVPLAELVQRLAKGKSLAELVRAARWRRKRPGDVCEPKATSTEDKAL